MYLKDSYRRRLEIAITRDLTRADRRGGGEVRVIESLTRLGLLKLVLGNSCAPLWRITQAGKEAIYAPPQSAPPIEVTMDKLIEWASARIEFRAALACERIRYYAR